MSITIWQDHESMTLALLLSSVIGWGEMNGTMTDIESNVEYVTRISLSLTLQY